MLKQKEESTVPTLYLSPSTQEWNPYVTGSGSEEYLQKYHAYASKYALPAAK